MFSSLQNGGLFLLSYTELARAECGVRGACTGQLRPGGVC